MAKFTYEQVKVTFEKEGYTLLSTEYVNTHTKLDMLCPKGHSYSTRFYSFQFGNRCTTCSGIRRFTYEEVKAIIEKKNWTLVSKTYKNCMTKLELKCPNGHICYLKLNTFSQGNGCAKCAGTKKFTIEDVRDFFAKRNEILLSKEYININQKLHVLCPSKHEYYVVYNAARGVNRGCTVCRGDPHNIKKTFKEVQDLVNATGFELISKEYLGITRDLDVKCPKGHIRTTSLYYLLNNKTCVGCSRQGTSKQELDVLEWVKQYYPLAAKKRFYVDPKNHSKYMEYDIFVPELKLAIEYNGLVWHSEKFDTTKRMFQKYKWAEANNIRVINIFEDEWIYRNGQVKSFLTSVFNKNTVKIGARKTSIKSITKEEANVFLDNYHIQGKTTAIVSFGLFYNNELVGVIGGNKHHRQGHNELVLNRLAFKTDTTILGGASKLLKSLLNYAKTNNYSKLISWSDNRWSQGNVYKQLGFTLEEEMKPDYSYVDKKIRLSKQSCQKKFLVKKGGIGDTEREMATSLNLHRIWDCGKKRWSITIAIL